MKAQSLGRLFARLAKLVAHPSDVVAQSRDITRWMAQPGPHEQHISTVFDGRTQFDGTTPVLDCPLLLVAFTNRSGSNLLCEYLSQTGHMAVGGECLNYTTVANQRLGHAGRSFPDHLVWLAGQLGAGRARHLTLKASYDQMAMLLRWNIPAMFPALRVIHIRRRDALAQAVSLSVARQTERWTSHQPGRAVSPEWRPAEIATILAGLRLEQQGIGLLTHAAGLPLREIAYEDMVADPAGHLRAALRFCGMDPAGWTPATPHLEQQKDADKSAFLERARAEMWAAFLDPDFRQAD